MSSTETPTARPRLLLMVIFFSFFLGIQSLLDSISYFFAVIYAKDPELLEKISESTIFSQDQMVALQVYNLIFSLVLLVSAYFLMTQTQERSRRILKAALVIDVFLFLAIMLYYSHLKYSPPDSAEFYYQVFCTLFEILLIIGISHPSVIAITQSGSDEPSDPKSNQTKEDRSN